MSVTLTRQELYDRVWTEPVDTLAKEYGLSNVGLGKACCRHDIPVPPRAKTARYAVTPWHEELEHRQFAQDRMVLAVPRGHPLTKRERIRLRDLRNMPFIWFHRWVNPTFYDQMMEACARGGLSAPRIVQEATDRDTVLGLVQCQIGIAWVTESTRWHCPRSVVLLPVNDMNVRLPFNVIWKKDNASPLRQKFLAQVQASQH